MPFSRAASFVSASTKRLVPGGLHARMCWLFTLSSIGADVTLAGQLLLNPQLDLRWVAALAALVGLAALQFATQRRGGPK